MSTLSLTFANSPGTVTLPIAGSGLAVSIDWENNGTTNTSLTHNYSGTGPYIAVITVSSGTVTRFGYSNGSAWPGADKLTEVATNDTSTWGLPGVSSFLGAFYGCSALTVVPTQIPSSVTSLEFMFVNAYVFNQNIRNWDVSSVTNMWGMFYSQYNPTAFNQPIGSWDVSNVTTMTYMFQNCSAFNQDIGNWDVANVTGMRDMFNGAAAFNQDIRYWDTTSVTDFFRMFNGATAMNTAYSASIGWGTSPNYTPASTFFNQFSDNGVTYYFTEDSNNDVTITGAVSSTGSPATIADITIPGSFTVAGVVHTIRHIGSSAFYNNLSLIHI